MSGLIDALIGGLAGGANYVAQDAARRQEIDDRAAGAAAERDAVFADFKRRHEYLVGNLEADALAQAKADTAGYLARDDLRDAQIAAVIKQQEANDAHDTTNPMAVAKHNRELRDKLAVIKAGQAAAYAQLAYRRDRDDEDRRNKQKVVELGTQLGAGAVEDPRQRAGMEAAIIGYDGNPKLYQPATDRYMIPAAAGEGGVGSAGGAMTRTERRTVPAEGQGGRRLPDDLVRPFVENKDINAARQKLRAAATQTEMVKAIRDLSAQGWSSAEIKAIREGR